MSKKTTLSILGMVLLAGALVAQERAGAPGGPMRGGMQTLLSDLEAAYKANDREKMGQLIEDMKQRSSQMRPGMGRPEGPPEGFGGPGRGMRPGQEGAGDEFFTNTLMAKNDTEKKILAVLDELDRNQRRGNMNVPVLDGRLLRVLTESIGAKHVVEVGTSNGYSGIWLALALQKTGGKLTPHEIDSNRASMARENFKKAGVDTIITLVEGDAHETVAKIKEPIDLL